MNIIIPIIICLVIFAISSYLCMVLVTFSKSEDFGEIISIKVSLFLPLLIFYSSISISIKHVFKDRKVSKTALKMATVDYPVAIVMLFAIVEDHRAQINLYGDSTYTSTTRNKESHEIERRNTKKTWFASIVNIKEFVNSDAFKNNFKTA